MDREKIISDFIELLEAQEDGDEVLDIIRNVTNHFCIHCGKNLIIDHCHIVCHCTNDD